MRFREVGASKPVVQLEDRAGLEAYLREQFRPWPDLDDLDLGKLSSERYSRYTFDAQAGEEPCFLIILPGYGAVGYANQPLS